MTLSWVLLFLIPLFLIPAFLLPQNRIRFFSFCALIPFLTLFLLFIANFLWEEIGLEQQIGKTFFPLFSGFLSGFETLSLQERYHLSAYLFYEFLYLLLYLIVYVFLKIYYIGSNPNIHKPTKAIRHALDILIFLVVTYGVLGVFLIEIREIIPLPDGLFKGFFSWFYPIGA
jgi:hypothetical protein